MTATKTNAIARICERWTMELEIPDDPHAEWFLDWAIRSTKDAGKHLTSGWLAYTSLLSVYGPEDIQIAHETFGGMGAQSLMIQELFAPKHHTVGEWAWAGVAHLQRTLPTPVRASRMDAYSDQLPAKADLYGLDFGDLTVWGTRHQDAEGRVIAQRALLDKVFFQEPKAVVFTDIACRYLHLHRTRYESLLGPGTCGSYPDYLRALLSRLEVLYGYTLVRGYFDRWSTVMALVPVELKDSVPGELIPTPATPIGLEVL